VALVTAVCLKLWSGSTLLSFGLGTVLLALSIATIDCALVSMKRLFEVSMLQSLGVLSYSLYLWQQPFYKLVRNEFAPAIALLPGAILAELISFYLIEQPARRSINHYWQTCQTRQRVTA
jgi:peptidoglycan/LPS O-acetylase OafA/YrhL